MSKFIDKLKQLSEGTPQPMGFGRSQAATSKPKIQLLACFDSAVVDGESASDADAAFVKITGSAAGKDILKGLSEKAKIPWGVLLAADRKPAELENEAADFIVFPAGLPVNQILAAKPGKLIQVDMTASDSLVRALNGMPVDAVVVLEEGRTDGFTWRDMMAIHRIAGLLSKPVILPVPTGVSKAELQAIWEAGIDGVVVSCSADPRNELKQLRELINQLDYPKPPRQERTSAIAPHPSIEPEQHEDEEEEDDE